MDLIADILLIAGAIGVAFYCVVLSRRLNRFNDLEKGVGGAVAMLSAQVDDMTKTLRGAQSTAASSTEGLIAVTTRAENVAKRLELMMASMHDLPQTMPTPPPNAPPATVVSDAPVQTPVEEPAATEEPVAAPEPESPVVPETTRSAEALFLRHRMRNPETAE